MRQIKDFIKVLLALLYACYLSIKYRGNYKVIVYYHGISSRNVDRFRKQINYLEKECKIVKLSEILNEIHSKDKKVIAITFDDAFENLIDNALPILQEKKIPAAIFVPVGNMSALPKWNMSPRCLDSKEKVMSPDHLLRLDRAGYEICSHTMTHPKLAEVNHTILRKEVFDSKKELERILGHAINSISYPHGSYNDLVISEAKKAGYEFGYTIEPEILFTNNDRLSLPRVPVSLQDNMFILNIKLRGGYGFMRKIKKMKVIIKKIIVKSSFLFFNSE